MGKVLKGYLKRGWARCGGFGGTLSVVLKTRSLGFYRTFSGAKWGFDRTFCSYQNPCRGSIGAFGGFDRTFLGRSPISGYCFQSNNCPYQILYLVCNGGHAFPQTRCKFWCITLPMDDHSRRVRPRRQRVEKGDLDLSSLHLHVWDALEFSVERACNANSKGLETERFGSLGRVRSKHGRPKTPRSQPCHHVRRKQYHTETPLDPIGYVDAQIAKPQSQNRNRNDVKNRNELT